MGNVTDLHIEEALYKTGGNISEAARLLDRNRQTLWKRIKKSKSLTDALEGFREHYVDIAESLIHRKFKFAAKISKPLTPEELEEGKVEIPPDKDTTDLALKYLKLQGKDRGYSERQEVTGANGAPVGVLFHQGLDQIMESLKANPDLLKKVEKELIDED
jgi:hypothetical protein